jgi:hypothetical protein
VIGSEDPTELLPHLLVTLGGGWTHAGVADRPFSMALGVVVGVPWDRTNELHVLRATLVTDDGEPVQMGDVPVEAGTEMELGRPPGLKRGTQLNAVLAFQFNGVVLPAGGYVWELWIGDESYARAPFWVV